MQEWFGLAAAILAAIAVGAVLLTRRRLEAFGAATAKLALVSDQLAQAQGALAGQMRETSSGLSERLDSVGKRVQDSLAESSDKAGKSLSELQARLAVIDAAQQRLTELSTQVVGLQDILDNKQARGAFGEDRLENLVTDALPAGAYEFQKSLSNGKRADCLVHLPNPPGPVAIDAKFPLESYRAFVAAKDDAARVQAARSFTTDMQSHIEAIATRYIVPGETAEGALLFLPSESIYGELHVSFGNLVEAARRRRVHIVSPNTLWAMLHSMCALMRDIRMRQQTHAIQKQVGLLVEDVQRLEERVDNLRKHFGQAEKDIKEIETSAGKIVRQGERIAEAELEESEPALPAPTPRLAAG